MTKPEKERRTGENLGVQPKNLTLVGKPGKRFKGIVLPGFLW